MGHIPLMSNEDYILPKPDEDYIPPLPDEGHIPLMSNEDYILPKPDEDYTISCRSRTRVISGTQHLKKIGE